MSEVILVTATCGWCGGRLKGWHDDYAEPRTGEYVHVTVGGDNPSQHDPGWPVAGSVKPADYDLWHVLPGMGW